MGPKLNNYTKEKILLLMRRIFLNKIILLLVNIKTQFEKKYAVSILSILLLLLISTKVLIKIINFNNTKLIFKK